MPVAIARAIPTASQRQSRHRQPVEASFCEVGKLGCQHDRTLLELETLRHKCIQPAAYDAHTRSAYACMTGLVYESL